MRIALGQFYQETNTFNQNPTVRADFEKWGIAVGDEIIRRYGETGEIGGFVTGCRARCADVQFAGLERLFCWPWGRIEEQTWRSMQKSFAEQLAHTGPVDGVLLSLHGSLAAFGEDDVDGALLEQVRRAVGPQTPIACSLDLHANITKRMVANADLLVGYHTSPHLDSFETGRRAADGLMWMIEHAAKPVTYWRKLPMFVAAESHNTFTGLPAPVYRQLEKLEQDPRVLSACLYMVMPWLDCKELGWVITLTTTESDRRWNEIVDDLSRQCWELREPMSDIERFSPADVVAKALAHGGHPIVIGDGADATNSGSPGDGTHLLREFLRQQPIPHGAMTFIIDPEAVAVAVQAGVGGPFKSMVGGTFAPEFSDPVEFHGTVERLLDVNYILDGHAGKNLPIHMGRGAVVRSGDVTVLFAEKSGPGSSPLLYEAAGLDPRNCGIVVAKSPAGFRADYDPFVAATFLADCPGCATTSWDLLDFRNADRPLWPLDRIEKPEEAAWCKR